MVERGDTILIKVPTKRNPERIIEAYVYNVVDCPSKPPFLQTKAVNGRKINLYENSPIFVCVVDDKPEEESNV